LVALLGTLTPRLPAVAQDSTGKARLCAVDTIRFEIRLFAASPTIGVSDDDVAAIVGHTVARKTYAGKRISEPPRPDTTVYLRVDVDLWLDGGVRLETAWVRRTGAAGEFLVRPLGGSRAKMTTPAGVGSWVQSQLDQMLASVPRGPCR